MQLRRALYYLYRCSHCPQDIVVLGQGGVEEGNYSVPDELTALYGIDHARTLAIVCPAMMRQQRARKAAKILQYGERVWGIGDGSDEQRIEATIARTEEFFQSLGVGTRLNDYDATEGIERVGQRLAERGESLGEHGDLTQEDVDAILALGA